MKTETGTVKVWDPLVRIGHWALVIAFTTAYITGEEWLNLHVWAGYSVAGIVLLRITWGLIGSRNARFSEFVRGPGATLRYLGEVATGKAKRYIGHNPAGAAMVVALLVSLSVTTVSGLMIYGIEENAGPLAGVVDADAPAPALPALVATAQASDDEYEGGHERAEEFWEEVHEVSANATLFLVLLHIAGVLFTSLKHRENLVRAMFTGRKRA